MATVAENGNSGGILVRGAGAAGVQAALDLAASGLKVCLTDPSPALGGAAARPVSAGLVSPKSESEDNTEISRGLREKLEQCARHKNIEILTLAETAAVTGQPGDFQVRIRRSPRYVDPDKCTACGECSAVCPVRLPGRPDGVPPRPAIALEHPGAIPHVYNIVKYPGQTTCTHGCPAGVNVPGFISLLRAGKIAEAYALLRQRCPLPASSGRICRHHCEDNCRRLDIDEEAVAIRHLERYVADAVAANAVMVAPVAPPAPENPAGRVAIIGGGPAGLTAAHDLARQGVKVTLFEAQEKLGGLLRYGIPAWRMPKDVLEREIQLIIDLGIDVRLNARVSAPKLLLEPGFELNGETFEPFDAVLLATGAWAARRLDLPGENSRGVWQALNFLCAVNSGDEPALGAEVVVLGGDDLALEAARAALRLPGVQTVHLACLESWAEMPADADEVSAAFREGVVIHNGLGPTGFARDGERVTGVRFRACTSVYDEHRSFDPIFDDTAVSLLAADAVIIAAGRAVADVSGYEVDTRPGGRIFVYPETSATTVKGIFACGDAVSGPASMAEAMAAGHRSAEAILARLRPAGGAGVVAETKLPDAGLEAAELELELSSDLAPNPRPDAEPGERAEMPRASAGQTPEGAPPAKPDRAEINTGYDRGQAQAEAERCLDCGLCSGCQECARICPAGAIDLDARPRERERIFRGVIITDAAGGDWSRRISGAGVCRTGPAGDLTPETEDITDALVRGGAAAAEILRQQAELAPAHDSSRAALIIGGGVAGLTAAHYIAGQGFPVHLVEKSGRPGGMLAGRQSTLDIENLPEYAHNLEKAVRTHPRVTLYLNSEVGRTEGRAGAFTSTLRRGQNEIAIQHAVTIVATGGQPRPTRQYLLGQHQAVVTQSRLGEMLAAGELATALREQTKPTIVMLQCVESLTPEHPYCSRVCCAQALQNALEIKSLLPRSEIAIFGGERLAEDRQEFFYQQALERRIRFLRYAGTEGAGRPEVSLEPGTEDGGGPRLQVRAQDADSGRELVIYPDLLVLATGIAPAADNPALAQRLDERLTPDGFFLTAHPRLRPVELGHEGVFTCGAAHRPCFIREAAAEAKAVAARAAALLSGTADKSNG